MRVICEKEMVTTATKEAIWQVWQDVANWNVWDTHIEWATLNGDFKVGQTGALKPRGGPTAKFVITQCSPYAAFTDISPLPLATLIFEHKITPNKNGNLVTHRILISGPLAFLFKKLLGKKLANGLDVALPNLIKKAEAHVAI
jgi:hypothetical protein